MTKADKIFKEHILDILENGVWSHNARPKYADGSTANSKYITMTSDEYDLPKGEFPIITLRRIAVKTAINEMLVFYQDKSNKLEDFEKRGVGYWKSWEVKNSGTIGNTYGEIVRRHNITDRMLEAMEKNPWNRRNILSLWDYKAFDEEPDSLLPCAWNTMFDVREVDGEIYLDQMLTMRSNDMLVAQHMDTMQYVALQMMIAKHFGWKLGRFRFNVMNMHIYSNQGLQAGELLLREGSTVEPKLILDVPDGTNFYDITVDDFKLVDYNPVTPQVKFPDLAV